MRKIYFLFTLYIKSFIRFVFAVITGGDHCLICGEKTFIYPVCRSCLQKKYMIIDDAFFQNRCRICGKTLVCENDLCSDCRNGSILKHLDKSLPLFSYRLWNKELMFMWKSKEVRSLSQMFAKILNQALKQLKAEYIVPVPPRKGKIKEKGWDQIDEICNLLKFKYGYKVLHLLERRTRVQQKTLDREGRMQQIGKAYFCVPHSMFKKQLKPYGNVLPQKVVLVDDVCTTGSTLESCAAILKEAGIKEVTGLTLFLVD